VWDQGELQVATTEDLDPTSKAVIKDALEGLGGSVRLNPRIERRGAPSEVWHFVLETDWSVVRDAVIATAIGAGVPAGLAAIRRGAESLARRFRRIGDRLPGERGRVVLRDTRSGIEIELDWPAPESYETWMKLLRDQTLSESVRKDVKGKRPGPR
jgi:hypothetical protein